MPPIFTPKRVSVPGLLSDDGLAVAVDALRNQKTAAPTAVVSAPLPAPGDLATVSTQMPSPKVPGLSTAPGIKLSAGPAPQSTAPAPQPQQSQMQPGFGMLSAEQGAAEQAERIKAADADVAAVTADNELGEKLRNMTDEQAAEFDIPRDPFATPDELAATKARLAGQEAAYLDQTKERADFIRQSPAPQMTWWLDAAQVGARAAAQTGTSALKYPFSAFESLTYLGTGIETGKLAPRGWLDEVDTALNKILPGDPTRSKDFVSELAAGGGSFVPFLLAGYLGAAVGLPAGVTAGGLGAAATGNQMYEEAESFDASMLQKSIALLQGSALGATEAVPIDRMFMRADQGTGGLLRRMLASSTASTVEEFTQEFSQAIGEDMIAKYGAGYDPDRKLDASSWIRQGAIGGIVGGVAGGVTAALPTPGGVSEAQQTAAAEEVFTREQDRFNKIVGEDIAVVDQPETEGAPLDAADGESAAAVVAPQAQQDATGADTAVDGAAVAQPPVDGVRRVIDAVAQRAAAAKQQTAAQTEGVATVETGEVLLDPNDPMTAVQVAPAVETPEFKTWFGDSVVRERATSSRDREAKPPLKVYHGTQADFTAFNPSNEGSVTFMGIPTTVQRHGMFFAEDRAFAETFANQGGKSGRVVDAYLAIKNPLWVDQAGVATGNGVSLIAEEDIQNLVSQGVDERWAREYLGDAATFWEAFDGANGDFFVQAMKDAGYDGVFMQEIDPDEQSGDGTRNVWVAFEPTQIKSATGNSGAFDPANPDINEQVASPYLPTRQTITAVAPEASELSALPGIEKGLKGPIPIVVQAAKAYANAVGLPLRRQRDYVKVDVARAGRIAQAYADMPHQPNDPAVLAAYQALADETSAQYQFVKATGIKIETIMPGQPDPYPEGPRQVLEDINRGHIWYFPTGDGFGSSDFDPTGNPLLNETAEVSDNGEPMVVNDLFRVVHDFFGHGMEGAGFGARGEENAWQAHMRLFSEAAVPAMTSETRGQNSWVNYGPFGAQNRADPRNTTYADQKTGIMPSWTWREGVADSAAYTLSAPVEVQDAAQFRNALTAAKEASRFGGAVNVYSEAEYAKMRTFLSEDGLAGFALKDGDIVSVFSHPAGGGGRLRSLIDSAIANGGTTLDAFDTGTADRPGLPQMYAALGFVETSRQPFNPKFKPADWPEELGTPDVVFMEYAADVEQLVAAPLFGGGALPTVATGPSGRVLVKDVAQALHDAHMRDEGKKLYPETDEADYARVLAAASADFAAQVDRPNSGIGWYTTDVNKAIEATAQLFPTLLTNPAHRDLYLTFAGVFSNGLDPDQAWVISAEAFEYFIATGKVPVVRIKPDGTPAKMTTFKDNKTGKPVTKAAGWGVRNSANEQQLALIGYLVEREGGVIGAMEWLKGQQKRTDINAVMLESGLYKAGRFTTKAAQQGETFGFLALGEKLGRYTLGLHGVELEADNTTVDLWYTRTFRRWTGRLFDTPIGNEGIAGGVANDAERAAVFRITDDLQKQYQGITAGDVQAVLWFFEKRLYAEHGIKTNEGTNSSGARKLLSARGIDDVSGGAEAGFKGSAARALQEASESVDVERMAGGTSSTRMPYAAEPTRPTRGVADNTAPAADTADVKLTAISANFTKLLNLTVRHGRLVSKGGNTMGEYNRKSTTIRLRVWSDLSTLVHEGGHAINDMMAAPLNAFVQRNAAEIMRIGVSLYAGDLSNANAATRQREGFAEFFRVYTLTPAFATNKWPGVVADFENTLRQADPTVLDGLNAIAGQFQSWLQLPSAKLIRNMVVDGRREQGINAAIKELKDLGFKSWFEEHTRRSVEWSTNRFAPLNRLVTDLLNQAERNNGTALDLKRADDPRTLVRLARNAGSRGMVEVTDGVYGYKSTQPMSRGLRDALMISQGVDPATTPGALDEERMKDFSTYLVARRSLDEFRRFDEGKIDRPPIGASKGDVLRAIKDYEKTYGKSFTDAADIVHEFGMALWQKQYDAGLMSKETYTDGLERQFYVPLQRDMSDKKANFGASALTAGSPSLVKRFRGSDRDIVDPMAVLMQKTFALETLINENEVVKSLALLADKVGKAGALVERIPASQVLGMVMTVEDAARQLSKDDTLTPADAQDLMTLLGASIKEGNSISLLRREQVSTAGENILFFWENGKPAAIQLKDGDLGADVVNALQAVGRENMPLFTGLVTGVSTAFRTAITSWPDFLVVNYIRDQMSAWILSDVGFKPFVTGIRGMADEVRQKQWAKSYNAAQGIMGGMNVAALHDAKIDQDIRALRSKGYIAQAFRDKTPMLGALRGFAEITSLSETGTRVGLYRAAYGRAKADGLNDYEASVESAYTATDYIDFGLNGSRMTLYRRTIPFLNAQLQGLYKMVRVLGADEVAQRKGLKFVLGAYMKSTKNLPLSRVEKDAINTGRKAWVKMATLGMISALLHFMFRDDPDYQETSEYMRVTGWVIPMGNGRVFYIPKPFELALMANAVERGLEFASGDSQAPARFLRGAALSLIPPTTPTSAQMITELALNKDTFTGRDIVPTYMQALEPQLQYDNYTSSLAKWMGSTFNWSPLVVDHVLSGLGASAYRDISGVINGADPTRPSMDETDAPLLRRFVRDVRRGSVSAADFWDQASNTTGRLERASQTYKRFTEYGNEMGANAYLATLSADEKAYATLMTHFDTDAKRLNPFYRARQVTSLVSGMRREISSELSLSDTSVKDFAQTIEMTAGKKQQVDEVLSEIARREVRNTLIATKQAGWAAKERLPLEPTLGMLLEVSPDTYYEFMRRREQRKIYNDEAVYEYWPEVRDRLMMDGEFAVLSDAVAVAGVVF